jgi:DNA repair protein RecO (recombination protein O)
MRVEWQPALVLHKRRYRETSLQLELLTRDHGIISLVAKGVAGAKSHILRAQLQPLQHIRLSYLLKSELGTLVQSEPIPPVRIISGERMMAGLYLNELILKLCPREDADSGLYELLLQALQGLAQDADLAWLVRRFEAELLQHLGFQSPWSHTANGEPIRQECHYRVLDEIGLMPANPDEAGVLSGADLLAFISGAMPSKAALNRLRTVMHNQIALHTGKAVPRSWQMIGELSKPILK